jgi:hypothetical protein
LSALPRGTAEITHRLLGLAKLGCARNRLCP